MALPEIDWPGLYGIAARDCEILKARIEALEAALRFILTDPPAALDEPDTDAEIIQHYREVARTALDKDTNR